MTSGARHVDREAVATILVAAAVTFLVLPVAAALDPGRALTPTLLPAAVLSLAVGLLFGLSLPVTATVEDSGAVTFRWLVGRRLTLRPDRRLRLRGGLALADVRWGIPYLVYRVERYSEPAVLARAVLRIAAAPNSWRVAPESLAALEIAASGDRASGDPS